MRSGINESQGETVNLQVKTSNLNPEAQPFTMLNSTLQHDSNQTILLQTITVTVFNPSNPGLCEEVKFILDSGSQQSYITQELKRRMVLKSQGRKSMSIVTFGSTVEK